jgi:hypothetical protein
VHTTTLCGSSLISGSHEILGLPAAGGLLGNATQQLLNRRVDGLGCSGAHGALAAM